MQNFPKLIKDTDLKIQVSLNSKQEKCRDLYTWLRSNKAAEYTKKNKSNEQREKTDQQQIRNNQMEGKNENRMQCYTTLKPERK